MNMLRDIRKVCWKDRDKSEMLKNCDVQKSCWRRGESVVRYGMVWSCGGNGRDKNDEESVHDECLDNRLERPMRKWHD